MVKPLSDFDRLVLHHSPIARREAKRLRDKFPFCHLDDLYAYCLVGVSEGLKSYTESRGKLFSYLCITARREGLQFVKRWKRRGFRLVPRGGEVSTHTLDDAPPERLLSEETAHWPEEDWQRVLAPLVPRERRVIEMCVRLGSSYDEAAEHLGITRKQAWVLYQRAAKVIGQQKGFEQ